MTAKWWHMFLIIAVGYALGYYFRGVGDMTLAKITG